MDLLLRHDCHGGKRSSPPRPTLSAIRVASAADGCPESEWPTSIRDGDHSAFQAMFRTYAPQLRVFVARQLRIPDAAEDVIQELFLRIWAQREVWAPERSVKSYLYRAAQNGALDVVRRQRSERQLSTRVSCERASGGQAAQQPDESVLASELQAAIRSAVEDLPKRCRLIFTLSRDQGLTYSHIAAALQISPKTVEVQMGRALRALRKRLSVWICHSQPRRAWRSSPGGPPSESARRLRVGSRRLLGNLATRGDC